MVGVSANQSATNHSPAAGAGPRRVSAEGLTRFAVEALSGFGVSRQHARVAADVLVTTDTWGTFSHGTNHLRNYCRKIEAGGIDAQAQPEVLRESGAWAMIDGHHAIGMVTACFAMEAAVAKARSCGLGLATVARGSHFGAAGYYANMAARAQMIGVAMSNSDPNMTVPGGRGHVIGNNPFSYAIPNGSDPPVFLDIALSVVAASKVIAAKKRGEAIPPDWIVDAEGIPTSDTGSYPGAGSLQPMAGHKGYGLAFMIEAIAGVLSGADFVQNIPSWLLNLPSRPNLGHAFLAIDVGALMPFEDFSERMKSMVRGLREAPRARGSERIYLPGEMEWERREAALANGICLPANVIEELGLLADQLGFDLSEVYL